MKIYINSQIYEMRKHIQKNNTHKNEMKVALPPNAILDIHS